MRAAVLLSLVSVVACAALALLAPLRKRTAFSSWSFAGGMILLGADAVCTGLSLNASSPELALSWQRFALLIQSFLPGVWLLFSLTYARGNHAEFLRQWRGRIGLAFAVPISIAVIFRSDLVVLGETTTGEPWIASTGIGRVLTAIILVAIVVVLSNLEKTFRAALGTMRWRIKFLILGLGVIFAARIYVGSQVLLFSATGLSFAGFQSGALLIGCGLVLVAYMRSGFAEIDIYPSHAILQGSVTMLIAGGYLFVVGIFGQIVKAVGGARYFQVQALLFLIGLTGLAALLLSDRLRQWRRRFVSRHFRRPQHDFRKVWTLFTERGSALLTEASLAEMAAKLICDTFDVLSVTIWSVDEGDRFSVAASTLRRREDQQESGDPSRTDEWDVNRLRAKREPFDLDGAKEEWADHLRRLNPPQFDHGGNRMAVPLLSRERWLGVAVIADRVGGLSYTHEELELLKCIGDQLAASILNLRLAEENMQAKELEAFQTLSAFFVHDLKNAASGLNLTLKNLPVHFDDPEFRADAFRGIAGTVERINTLISRLGTIRGQLEMRPVSLDLNQLIEESLHNLNGALGVELETNLIPIPQLTGDRDQLRSVIDNLLLNARDAVIDGGRIQVATSRGEGGIVLIVSDTGCGMSDDFLRNSLFRPFRTTKKKGIGIGMFQARAIVQAHKGMISVESEIRKGSTFKVVLPLSTASS